MNDIIERINEKVIKPTFDEFVNDKRNKNLITKIFNKYYNEIANEIGDEMLDDPQYYEEEDREQMDQIEAYENFSHSMGYQAEYDAATYTIEDLKRKFDYKKGDENDSEKGHKIAKISGHKLGF